MRIPPPPPPLKLNNQKVSVNSLLDLIAKTFSNVLKEDQSFTNQNISFANIPFANNLYDFVRYVFSESLPQNSPEDKRTNTLLKWEDIHSLKIDGGLGLDEVLDLDLNEKLIDLKKNRYLYIPNFINYGWRDNDLIFFPERTKSRHFFKIYDGEDLSLEKEVPVEENDTSNWYLSPLNYNLKTFEGPQGFGTSIDFIVNNYDYIKEELDFDEDEDFLALKNIYNNDTLPLFKRLYNLNLSDLKAEQTLKDSFNNLYDVFEKEKDVLRKYKFREAQGVCVDLVEERIYYINLLGQLFEYNHQAGDFFQNFNLPNYIEQVWENSLI